jgi:hypothetical protein
MITEIFKYPNYGENIRSRVTTIRRNRACPQLVPYISKYGFSTEIFQLPAFNTQTRSREVLGEGLKRRGMRMLIAVRFGERGGEEEPGAPVLIFRR